MSHLELCKPPFPPDLEEGGTNPHPGQHAGVAASAWHVVNDGPSTSGECELQALHLPFPASLWLPKVTQLPWHRMWRMPGKAIG